MLQIQPRSSDFVQAVASASALMELNRRHGAAASVNLFALYHVLLFQRLDPREQLDAFQLLKIYQTSKIGDWYHLVLHSTIESPQRYITLPSSIVNITPDSVEFNLTSHFMSWMDAKFDFYVIFKAATIPDTLQVISHFRGESDAGQILKSDSVCIVYGFEGSLDTFNAKKAKNASDENP